MLKFCKNIPPIAFQFRGSITNSTIHHKQKKPKKALLIGYTRKKSRNLGIDKKCKKLPFTTVYLP